MVSPIVILFILIVSLIMIFGCQQLFLRTPFIFFLKMNCSEKKLVWLKKLAIEVLYAATYSPVRCLPVFAMKSLCQSQHSQCLIFLTTKINLEL